MLSGLARLGNLVVGVDLVVTVGDERAHRRQVVSLNSFTLQPAASIHGTSWGTDPFVFFSV